MMQKVIFVYKQPYSSEEYGTESLWSDRLGDYYRINNIPFFAYNISLGDIVSVENDEGNLYFEEIIERSGGSTVQLVIITKEDASAVGTEFELLGCDWEELAPFNMLALNISKDISYGIIKEKLEQGEATGRWSFKESCMEHSV